MKNLFLGVALIVLLGIGGFVYRNAVEHAKQPIACPVNQLQCPDGTSVPHLVNSCEFPACPPPNVSLPESGLAFALPAGFVEAEFPDDTTIASYEHRSASTTASIIIRRFAINASSTALATIRETAIGATSGEPVPTTAFSSATLGGKNFTVVAIERFEAVVTTAYYLARPTDVLRFDVIERDVFNWTSPSLDISTLPAHKALRALLTTLE
jgi:hypothetical protein